ncbi:hypothetical protein QVD17_30880 [Tagetes erecta]|uniref:Uncharacterized protein n=1 Tax=Tagetes erecta TaxID=13708 RepID=A0AAD8K3K0_TARER|nr:hypothetical protein QVD17_30880 [Tagetes erecta]
MGVTLHGHQSQPELTHVSDTLHVNDTDDSDSSIHLKENNGDAENALDDDRIRNVTYFDSREELMDWAKKRGCEHRCIIVVSRSREKHLELGCNCWPAHRELTLEVYSTFMFRLRAPRQPDLDETDITQDVQRRKLLSAYSGLSILDVARAPIGSPPQTSSFLGVCSLTPYHLARSLADYFAGYYHKQQRGALVGCNIVSQIAIGLGYEQSLSHLPTEGVAPRKANRATVEMIQDTQTRAVRMKDYQVMLQWIIDHIVEDYRVADRPLLRPPSSSFVHDGASTSGAGNDYEMEGQIYYLDREQLIDEFNLTPINFAYKERCDEPASDAFGGSPNADEKHLLMLKVVFRSLSLHL